MLGDTIHMKAKLEQDHCWAEQKLEIESTRLFCRLIEPAPGRLSFSNETAGPAQKLTAQKDVKI